MRLCCQLTFRSGLLWKSVSVVFGNGWNGGGKLLLKQGLDWIGDGLEHFLFFELFNT